MKKTRTKHYVGAALVGLMLATCSVSVIGAQVKELTTQRVNLEQIQNELQTMLNEINMDIEQRGQSCMSLRGFSGDSLFSCRGLA